MAENNIKQENYTDEAIVHLEWNEHIRRRAGMYIGRLGNGATAGDGIYVLLKEVVDNCIDEYAMGYGKNVIIDIPDDHQVSVRDFGRGIPLGSVVRVVSELNTGGKFDDKNFKKSVGMNGVGTKAVNAMSSYFFIESYREGEASWAEFSRGILKDSGRREAPKEKNGTLVKFLPDTELFGDFSYRHEFVESLVKNYSYLKKGLTLTLNGTPYISKNGLLDLVNESLGQEPLYPPIHLEGEDIEIVLTHGKSYGENIASFVNGQNTRDGGTHLAAYREAIAKTVKEFFKKDYAPEDVRMGIVGAVSIQIQEPNFEGQTKTKLGSTYLWEKSVKQKDGSSVVDKGPTIRTFINDFVSKALNDYLHMHLDVAGVMQEKIAASEEERKEIAEVKKKSRERTKKTAVYNSKLRDCRLHFCEKMPKGHEEDREKTSIFITEGLSATGTITKVRDAQTQAVFSLRGKPINSYKESRKKVADNEELTLLVAALGIEEDLDNLRYNNIIVATDADDDGMHIRMLVLTFFMKYYPELIRRGHVYILQTPLFRVKNSKEVRYCYDIKEKEAAIKALKSGVEITRFKGLGEISSDEFVHFIDENMRLDPVAISDEESFDEIMDFFMGDNTPTRQKFITSSLRTEKDLEDIDI
ncbi:MAG: type IIA DNA topoisomerase subunit B [Bacteroidales bacterium]|nr:type IIA DNA topoisomerase subunit B [Bacteroidales bacterium]